MKRFFKWILFIVLIFALAATAFACNKKVDEPETPPHTHTFGEWTIVQDSTCTVTGTKKRVCPCGEEETDTIALKPHSFGEWMTVTAAACVTDGEKKRVCSVCGQEEKEPIPAVGHVYPEWLSDENGHWRICSVCEERHDDGTHTYVDGACSVCGYLEQVPYTDGIELKLAEDGKSYIVSAYTGENTEIVIPSAYKGLPVTAIAKNTFYGKPITSAVVPGSVKELTQAFYYCPELISITLGEGISVIGDYAISYCTKLTTVTLPSTVKTISNYAFYNDPALTSVTLNEGLEHIKESAFRQSGVTSLTVPSTLKSISKLAFYACAGLTAVDFGTASVEIGEQAFQSCTALVSLNFERSPAVLQANAFYGCNAITEINTGAVKDINGAFYKCSGITKVTLESRLQTMGENAFRECPNLSSVKILSSALETVGENAFYKCTKLKTVEFANGLKEIGASAFCETALGSVTLPDSVKIIGSYAFAANASMTRLDMGDGVEKIGMCAFRNCTNLATIIASDSIKIIDRYSVSSSKPAVWAFDGTAWYDNQSDGLVYIGKVLYRVKGSLSDTEVVVKNGTISIAEAAFRETAVTSVSLPDTLTYIGKDAFNRCASLVTVNIPSSVNEIGTSAFTGCSALTSVSFNAEIIGTSAFSSCDKLTTVNLGHRLKEIGDNAFKYTPVAEISLPSGVESIGAEAFSNSNVTGALSIPGTVSAIGKGAFNNNPLMTSLTVGEGVESIGAEAFNKCSALENISLPSSIVSMGENVFKGTAWLAAQTDTAPIYVGSVLYSYKSSTDKGTELRIKDGTKVIAKGAFTISGYADFNSLYIPASVVRIEEGAFRYRSLLTHITVDTNNSVYYSANNCVIEKTTKTLVLGCRNSIIPNDGTVTKIGKYAFDGTGPDKMVLPDSVETIDEYAFRESLIKNFVSGSGLRTIESNAFIESKLVSLKLVEGVENFGSYAFNDCRQLVTVEIPSTAKSRYSGIFKGCINLFHIRNLSERKETSPASKYGEVLTSADAEFTNALTVDDNGVYILTVGDKKYFVGYDGGKSEVDLTSYGIYGVYDYCLFQRSDVTTIKLPSTVKEIGLYAFAKIGSDKVVYYNGTQAQWAEVTLSNRWNFDSKLHKCTIRCTDGDIEQTV